MYGIHVVFNERGYWSKSYTYKSEVPYEIGDVLVVPAGKFYNCVKVTGCTENYEFPEGITFKYVHSKVEVN